ncbi:hypothetical protein LXL04_000045 [Taraxacum kok-saghyz]
MSISRSSGKLLFKFKNSNDGILLLLYHMKINFMYFYVNQEPGNDVGTLSASTKGKDKIEDMVKEKTTKTMKSEKLGKYTFICVFELFTVFCLGVIAFMVEYQNNSTFKDTDNEINDDHIVIAGQDFWIPTVPEDIKPKEDGCYTSREAIEEIYYTYAHVLPLA